MQLIEINSSVENCPLASSRYERELQLLAALVPQPLAPTIRLLHHLCPLHLIIPLSVHNHVAWASTSAVAVCDSPLVQIRALATVTVWECERWGCSGADTLKRSKHNMFYVNYNFMFPRWTWFNLVGFTWSRIKHSLNPFLLPLSEEIAFVHEGKRCDRPRDIAIEANTIVFKCLPFVAGLNVSADGFVSLWRWHEVATHPWCGIGSGWPPWRWV